MFDDIYDKEGNKIDLMTWNKLHQNIDYIRIKQDTLPNGKLVSTVWLGMNHNFGRGKPLIFETMVFLPESFNELDMERYSTLEEAQKGHEIMVKKYS